MGYRGPADAISQNIDVIEHSRAEQVLVLASDLIYRMDYGELLRHHASSGKELTVVTAGKGDVPIGVCVFTRQALIRATRSFATSAKSDDFDRIILKMKSKGSGSYRFNGYVREIDTVDDYYRASMDILPGRVFDPYGGDPTWPIRTLSGVPLLEYSRYATSSRVALAARIKGATVSNSVVSFAARVNADAHIENSVIMNGAEIGRGARIRNAVVAENAMVQPNAEIGFGPASRRDSFCVTPGGVIVVDSQDGAKQRYEQRRAARVATRQFAR
jgi:glucose-1-phosphate adenylyltransferase